MGYLAGYRLKYLRLFGRIIRFKLVLTEYGPVVKWLSRLPVTEEIAGSNPVGPAIEKASTLLIEAFSMI